jgi:ATP-binding cassette, subfamily B, bacterial PglK
MINTIYKILSLISVTIKLKFFALLMVVFLISSALEVLSISAIIPFIGILLGETESAPGGNNWLVELVGDSNQLLVPIVMIFIFFVAAVLRTISLRLQLVFGQKIGTLIAVKLCSGVLNLRYDRFKTYNHENYASTVTNKIELLVSSGIFSLMNLINSSILLIGILSFLLYLNSVATLIVMATFVILYGFLIYILGNKIRKYGQIFNTNLTMVHRQSLMFFDSFREIKLNKTDKYFEKQFENLDNEMRQASAYGNFLSTFPKFALEFIIVLLVIMLSYAGLHYGYSSAELIVIIGAFGIAAIRLLPIAQQFFAGYSNIKNVGPPVDDIYNMLEQFGKDSETRLINAKKDIFFESLVLQDVTYTYNSSFYQVIYRANIKIERGQWIGISGPSGAGKSTLVDLILGLLPPSNINGKLLINNIPMHSILNNWHSILAQIAQQVYIADVSLAENVALPLKLHEINHQEVEKLLNFVGLNSLIDKSLLGYSQPLGRNGDQLSGGQRQRLAFARALYKKPQILVLDEATSALDQESEHELLEKIKCTYTDLSVIMVSHNPNNFKHCDELYFINKGKVELVNE